MNRKFIAKELIFLAKSLTAANVKYAIWNKRLKKYILCEDIAQLKKLVIALLNNANDLNGIKRILTNYFDKDSGWVKECTVFGDGKSGIVIEDGNFYTFDWIEKNFEQFKKLSKCSENDAKELIQNIKNSKSSIEHKYDNFGF